jgi:hypothetical protein
VASLAAEVRSAASGLIALVRGRPAWADGFDLTVRGFVRSFAAPLAALPLAVADTAIYHRAVGAPLAGPALLSAGLAHLLDAFGFAALLAAIAGPLRFKPGYAAFVIVDNWATLFLNVILSGVSLLALGGADGMTVFAWTALLLLGVSVALTWRIARETLTHELAPLVLVVVLSIGWSALADRVAQALFGV